MFETVLLHFSGWWHFRRCGKTANTTRVSCNITRKLEYVFVVYRYNDMIYDFKLIIEEAMIKLKPLNKLRDVYNLPIRRQTPETRY